MSMALDMFGMALMRLSTVSRISLDLTKRRGRKALNIFSTLTNVFAVSYYDLASLTPSIASTI